MLGTIVVAESSRTVRRMVEISLAKHPCNLVFASDGASALELVQTESPAMAIVDASLPGGGYETASKIKAGGKTKVILLVGRSQNFDMGMAQKAGIDGHIQKPFLTQQLVEKVFTTLGQAVPDKAIFRSTTMTIPLANGAKPPTGSPSKAPKEQRSFPPPPSSRPMAPPPSQPRASGSRLPPPVSKSVPPPPPPSPMRGAPAPSAKRISVPPVSADAAPAPPSRAPQPPPMDAFASNAVKATMQAIASDTKITSALEGASREVVEQIAWEVVPRLAEAILKEEIARLVRERLAAS